MQKGRVYSWKEVGERFDFKENYLLRAGGMVPRPTHQTVLLITHPGGRKSFDYRDYWDGADLIYAGKGLEGNQVLEGTNRDVAENRRRLLLFEGAGPRRLKYLGVVSCTDLWEAEAPDRLGRNRRVYRFRLRLEGSAPRRREEGAGEAGTGERGRRNAYEPRPFDPTRTAPERHRGQALDPEKQVVLTEQADQTHQTILVALGNWLSRAGWTDLEEVDGATDLIGVRTTPTQTRRTLFEVKSLQGGNERTQVRSGLSQLLEYRFFLGEEEDALCLVTNRLISDRRLQLLDSLGIAHVYLEGDALRVSGTRASRQLFPKRRT